MIDCLNTACCFLPWGHNEQENNVYKERQFVDSSRNYNALLKMFCKLKNWCLNFDGMVYIPKPYLSLTV